MSKIDFRYRITIICCKDKRT